MKHPTKYIISIMLSLVMSTVIVGCGVTAKPAIYLDFAGVNAAVSRSTHGLRLTLALNAAAYQPGTDIFIVLDEQNTLSSENKVRISYTWHLNGLVTSTPCNPANYPFGVAVYQGNYTTDKLAKIKPLYLFDPGNMYHCMAGPAINFTYIFKPLSDLISLRPDDAELNTMKDEIKINGYWTDSSEFKTFEPGVYTVAAADEWGALAIVHFTVTP
jgi:hypothetical protein